jgi:hypothetical protein
MIQTKTYTLNNLTLSNEILNSYINKFWLDIFTDIKDTSHLMLMVKVQFNELEMGYRTLGHLRLVNFSDKELFIDYLTQRLGYLNDSYMSHSISNITFSFIVKSGICNESNRALLQDLTNKTNTSHNFNNMKLPITMVIEEYGDIRAITKFDTFTRYIVKNGPKSYEIDVSLDGLTNKVTVLGAADIKW